MTSGPQHGPLRVVNEPDSGQCGCPFPVAVFVRRPLLLPPFWSTTCALFATQNDGERVVDGNVQLLRREVEVKLCLTKQLFFEFAISNILVPEKETKQTSGLGAWMSPATTSWLSFLSVSFCFTSKQVVFRHREKFENCKSTINCGASIFGNLVFTPVCCGVWELHWTSACVSPPFYLKAQMNLGKELIWRWDTRKMLQKKLCEFVRLKPTPGKLAFWKQLWRFSL